MSRVNRAWREGGWRLLLSRTTRAALSPVVSFGLVAFFARSLDDPGAVPGARADGIAVEAALADAAGLLLMGREQPDVVAAEIRRRFERGDRCFVARNADGRYVHSRWLSSRPTLVPELGRCVAPAAGQVYMYDGYTRLEARGRGIDGAVRSFIFALLASEGNREVLSYVRGTNAVGLAAARKWQSPVGSARYLRVRAAGPWVFAAPGLRKRVSLIAPTTAAELDADRDARATALREWFDSWLVEPMDKRSTGFSALPEAYFESAGAHLVDALALDPAIDKVLDVGCSSGGISRHVALATRKFVGVDVTAGLVTDIRPGSIKTATGADAEFAVADGRALPFPPGSFDKVYCTGVIHMLPAHDDAMRVVRELVRVCRPGGTVVVGAIPDEAKRLDEYRLLWRKADGRGKLRLAAALLTPAPLKRAIRGALKRSPEAVAFLKFDLDRMRSHFERQGFTAEILDYPPDYWSEDFRTTRSCLRLRVPARG